MQPDDQRTRRSPQAKPSDYCGPQQFFELKGPVGEVKIGKRARDKDVAGRLWEVSEQLTGVRWSNDSSEADHGVAPDKYRLKHRDQIRGDVRLQTD